MARAEEEEEEDEEEQRKETVILFLFTLSVNLFLRHVEYHKEIKENKNFPSLVVFVVFSPRLLSDDEGG